MAPLILCAYGIAFVFVVVRIQGVDVVPDSLGLALYAYGLWRLASQSRTLVVATALSGLGAVVALLDLMPGLLSDQAETGVTFAFNILVTLAIGLGALGLRSLARASEGGAFVALLVVAGLAAIDLATFVFGWGMNASDHERALDILAVGQVVNLLVIVGYVVLLVVYSSRDWAQPRTTSDVVPTPQS